MHVSIAVAITAPRVGAKVIALVGGLKFGAPSSCSASSSSSVYEMQKQNEKILCVGDPCAKPPSPVTTGSGRFSTAILTTVSCAVISCLGHSNGLVYYHGPVCMVQSTTPFLFAFGFLLINFPTKVWFMEHSPSPDPKPTGARVLATLTRCSDELYCVMSAARTHQTVTTLRVSIGHVPDLEICLQRVETEK